MSDRQEFIDTSIEWYEVTGHGIHDPIKLGEEWDNIPKKFRAGTLSSNKINLTIAKVAKNSCRKF